MFCDKCGKELNARAAFCPYCGRKISDSIPAQPDQNNDSYSDGTEINKGKYVSVNLPRKNVVGKIICAIAAVLLVIGIFQVTNSRYRFNVDFYNECITNQSELSNSVYSRNLSRTYDEWIAEYGQKIRVSKVKAVTFVTIGIACGALGIYLMIVDKKKVSYE